MRSEGSPRSAAVARGLALACRPPAPRGRARPRPASPPRAGRRRERPLAARSPLEWLDDVGYGDERAGDRGGLRRRGQALAGGPEEGAPGPVLRVARLRATHDPASRIRTLAEHRLR